MKQSIQVSAFKGFSKQVENTPLLEKLDEIAGGKYRLNVEKIRLLIDSGKYDEASNVKRQLPSFTFSAVYGGKRKAEGMVAYNDVLILDFDKLADEEISRCRILIQQSPHTLFCFRSPSNNGLKVGVHYRDPETDGLRERLFATPEISTTELETYHKRVFELCRTHYETLTGVAIDASGSDIGRLCFVSYDPEIYINTQAINSLTPPQNNIKTPVVKKKERVTQQSFLRKELPGNPSVDCTHIDMHIQVEFQSCINYVQRKSAYTPGQRDTYIFALGNRCYRKGIPEDVASLLARQRYGGDPDIDIPKIMSNAYRYTDRTNQQEEEKKKPTAIRVLDFLGKRYEVRRNIVLENLEFRPITNDPDTPYLPIRKEDYNSMYIDTQYAGIQCQPHLVRTIVNSRFARNYNPFEDYFYSLPEWDTRTDHIMELAETMRTNNQLFWRNCFKRWLVGLVACALDDNRENQLALIIKGAQGKGKSTWIRRLLPPELKQYYRNGMLNPNNKDHMLLLSQRLIINLEEFEGMKKDDISELKRLISQDAVTERKAYGEEAGFYVRRASFIASTNEPRFLEDITGTRRFPTFTAEDIDYRKPVDHAAIYSQAIYLWKTGFRYWYEEEEFRMLNDHNLQYIIASQEEELFYVYFRKPLAGDVTRQWFPISKILSLLTIYGKIQPTKQHIRTLLKVLERDRFNMRMSENNIIEYEVVFQLKPDH